MTKAQFKENLRLQKKLNDDTNTRSWIFGITGKGNRINWLRCVHMETAELIDSRPWKHWKDLNAPANEDNEIVELTDIYHFLLSYGIHTLFLKKLFSIDAELIKEATDIVIEKDLEIEDKEFDLKSKKLNVEKYEKLLNVHKYKSLLTRLIFGDSINKEVKIEDSLYDELYNDIEEELISLFEKAYEFSYIFKNNTSLIKKYEHITKYALPGALLEPENDEDELSLELILEKEMYLVKILEVFFTLLKEEKPFNLHGLYLGKNVLNKFRQDNGYKEGTYKKEWNGIEDNVHMLSIINELGEKATFDIIYSKLGEIYIKLS